MLRGGGNTGSQPKAEKKPSSFPVPNGIETTKGDAEIQQHLESEQRIMREAKAIYEIRKAAYMKAIDERKRIINESLMKSDKGVGKDNLELKDAEQKVKDTKEDYDTANRRSNDIFHRIHVLELKQKYLESLPEDERLRRKKLPPRTSWGGRRRTRKRRHRKRKTQRRR